MRMSLRKFVPVTLLSVALGGVVAVETVLAQPANPQQQPAGPGGGGGGGRGGQPGGPGGARQQNTEGAMKAMNRSFRELRASVGDASKKEQSLMSVWRMQQACAGAKQTKPEHIEGDPTARLDEFRRECMKLMGMLVELEGQLMDGKFEEAKAMVKKIHDFEEASHKKFGVKEEEGEGEAPRPSGS